MSNDQSVFNMGEKMCGSPNRPNHLSDVLSPSARYRADYGRGGQRESDPGRGGHNITVGSHWWGHIDGGVITMKKLPL